MELIQWMIVGVMFVLAVSLFWMDMASPAAIKLRFRHTKKR